MGAEFSVNLIVRPFAIEMHIQLAQERSKGVGVSHLYRVAGPVGQFEHVIKTIRSAIYGGLENPFVSIPLSLKFGFGIGPVNYGQRFCVRAKGSDHLRAIHRVEPKDTEW